MTARANLVSVTVVRVGAPGVPYVVAVVEDNDGVYRLGRLDVDPDGPLPAAGSSVTIGEHDDLWQFML